MAAGDGKTGTGVDGRSPFRLSGVRMKVDVVIPVYRPEDRFYELVDRLEQQSLLPERIIIMYTREDGGADARMERFCGAHPRLEWYPLERAEFDHGATRQAGVERSEADLFVCMTQDALPADRFLLERLAKALTEHKGAAAAYARQLPEEDCRLIERYTRQFNYPAQESVRAKEDLPRLGIRTFFCSNVCAIYRRDIFDRLGGFGSPAIFNEDMVYAAGAVRAGYSIVYAAKAEVIHSHNYTVRQQFCRNFDLGVSHAMHPEVFDAVPPEGEGMSLVKQTAFFLLRRNPFLIPLLIVQSAAKYAGFRLGKSYERLPERLVRACSASPAFWKT